MIFDDVLELARSVSQFTIAGEGNVSVRDGDAMLIKASGSTLETMTDDDLVRCDLDGNAFVGNGTLFEDGFVRAPQNSMIIFPAHLLHTTPKYWFPFVDRYVMSLNLNIRNSY